MLSKKPNIGISSIGLLRCRARTSGGINIPVTLIQSWLLLRGELLNFQYLKVNLSSLLFINLTAAAICRGDPHCLVFMLSVILTGS